MSTTSGLAGFSSAVAKPAIATIPVSVFVSVFILVVLFCYFVLSV
jgi:hypothetical protein